MRRMDQSSINGQGFVGRVDKYLKTTKDMKLNMSLDAENDVITVTSCSDSDFAADKPDRNWISGGSLTVIYLHKADQSILVYHIGQIHVVVTGRARAAGNTRVAGGDWSFYDRANEHANG